MHVARNLRKRCEQKIELGDGFQYSLGRAVGGTLSICRTTVTLDQGVS